MTRLAALVTALAVAAVAAGAEPPPPKPGEIARLVEQLGGADFADREAAAKRLEELGAAAIDDLREACKSDDAELARRALELLRKAERRAGNEKTLTPTTVELDAKDQPLDAVLAELSKQAKCDVVLGGLKPEDLAGKKVTVSTGGRVSFWVAVLKVCDAGELQVAAAGGFLAPNAMPYLAKAKPGVRVAADSTRAVVLEARAANPRRPGAVYGSVLVEAVPFPKDATPEPASALVQVWPEPRLQWQAVSGVKVTAATDARGARLVPDGVQTAGPKAMPTSREGVVMVRNPDGSVTFTRGAPFEFSGTFSPNARQAVVRLKGGEQRPGAIKDFAASVFGTVRTGVEPLSQSGGLVANGAAVAGVGVPGVEMSAAYSQGGNGKLAAEVELSYDPRAVHPAGAGDELAGARGGNVGFGNHTVYGVRVTDADGKPYGLGLSGGSNQFDPTGRRVVMKFKLELVPDKGGHGPPAVATFWGTHVKAVEVPVTLKDVPLGK